MSGMFVHTIDVQRATSGAGDDYNQPGMTWATIATVKGLVEPKSSIEVAQLNQAGATVTDHSIFLPSTTDVREADRLLYQGETYQIEGLERRAYGRLRHLKANARKVTA